ncbi:unnamed protein product [Boreogadus saida]
MRYTSLGITSCDALELVGFSLRPRHWAFYSQTFCHTGEGLLAPRFGQGQKAEQLAQIQGPAQTGVSPKVSQTK